MSSQDINFAASPICDRNLYGPLDLNSCRDVATVMEAFGDRSKRLTWAKRDYLRPHIQVPRRFSSRKPNPSGRRFDSKCD